MKNIVLVLTDLITSAVPCCASPTAESMIVSFSAVDAPVFAMLLQLGSQENLPFGIVLEDREDFCKTKSVSVTKAPFSEVLERILAGSHYRWLVMDNIILVRPANMSNKIRDILAFKFPSFAGTKTTMNGLGVILSGYIHSRLHPGEGYAGDILSSQEEELDPFQLTNVSVEQIANHIISLDGKGVWLLNRSDRLGQDTTGQAVLNTYSYKHQAQQLRTLSCVP